MDYTELQELVAIANELDQRGLVKEAGYIDERINKLVKVAAWPAWVARALYVGGGWAASEIASAMSESESKAWAEVGVNPAEFDEVWQMHPDMLLYRWKSALTRQDLTEDIHFFGLGDDVFPSDYHSKADLQSEFDEFYGTKVRDIPAGASSADIRASKGKNLSVEEMSGESPEGILRRHHAAGESWVPGLEYNEKGWVGAFNTLIDYKNRYLESWAKCVDDPDGCDN